MYNYHLHLRTWLIIKKKQLLDAACKKTEDYQPFIILCEPRTGSTLLHTYLNFHPNILSGGEILREEIEKNHNGCLLKLTEDILGTHANHLHAVGLKLFYYYYDHPAYSNIFRQVLQRTDIKIIHLQRQDIFKLFVSLRIAQKTNTWSSVKNREKKQRIWIDPAEFKVFAETYTQRQKFFAHLFREHQVHNLQYENLVNSAQKELAIVQGFLGVRPRTLRSLLQKQNPDHVASVVVNYDQIANDIEEIKRSVQSPFG